MSVIVVGGGIVGLSCAYYLSAAGAKVTVIDEAPAKGCSYGNGGVIATDHLHGMINRALLKHLPRLMYGDYPALWLPPSHFHHSLPWLGKLFNLTSNAQCAAIARSLTALAVSAQSAWRPIVTLIGDSDLIRKQGRYYGYLSQAGFAAEKGIWADRKAHNIDFSFIDGKDFPYLNHQRRLHQVGEIADIYYVPSPYRLVDAFHRALKARGVTFIYQNVETVNHTPFGVSVTLQDGNIVVGDKLAMCAGVGNYQLLKPLGLKLPLISETGYAIRFSTPQPVVDRHTLIKERNLSISPTSDGFRMTGIVQLQSPVNAKRNRPNTSIFDYMRGALGDLIDLSQAKELECWTGNRPSLPDGLPMIGALPNHPNIYLATGHQHIGMTLGPISAQLLSAHMLNQPVGLDISPFSLTRFE